MHTNIGKKVLELPNDHSALAPLESCCSRCILDQQDIHRQTFTAPADPT